MFTVHLPISSKYFLFWKHYLLFTSVTYILMHLKQDFIMEQNSTNSDLGPCNFYVTVLAQSNRHGCCILIKYTRQKLRHLEENSLPFRTGIQWHFAKTSASVWTVGTTQQMTMVLGSCIFLCFKWVHQKSAGSSVKQPYSKYQSL